MLNIEAIKEVTSKFFSSIEIEYTSFEVLESETDGEKKIRIQLFPVENKAPLYIGYRGGNLYALQHLLKSVLWADLLPKDVFLTLDIDHYREKNEKKILDILDEKITMVLETGYSQTMPFLTPGDRRMVHMTVKKKYADTIETESFTNEEGKRTLKISKK